MLIGLWLEYILINIECFYLRIIKRLTSNRNEYVLFFHYINNYCVENKYGIFYFGDRLHDKYKGYNVKSKDKYSSSLELTENIKWNYKRLNTWYIANYEFNLPVDLKTVSRLRFNMDRKKYKFVYIMWDEEKSITDYYDSNIRYYLLDKYNKKMNFVYYYRTIIKDIDNINNIKKRHVCDELLINVDECKVDDLLRDLQEDINVKDINIIYKCMENELDFFNRKEINKIYPFSNYTYFHYIHSFKMCQNNIVFEDYNILGDYIMRTTFADSVDLFFDEDDNVEKYYVNTLNAGTSSVTDVNMLGCVMIFFWLLLLSIFSVELVSK
jgi:hypothetical protein